MSTAARPRPRPRARAQISASDDSLQMSPSTSAASIQTAESSTAHQEDDDLDAMFTKRRSASAWRDVDKKFKHKGTSSMRQELKGSEVERFGSEDTYKSSKLRQKSAKVERLPAWTNAKNIAVLQISSDEEVVHVSSNISEWIDHSPKGKRKRERSRSITPPPALPEHQLYHARKLVRETLNAQALPPPLTLTRDEIFTNDNISLNPELARIAAEILSEGVASVNHQSNSAEPTLVSIKVKWIPHPENPSDRSWLRIFRVDRDEELKELFESVSDEAGTRSVHLHVTYDGQRVFPSATPKALHIWSEAEFEACSTFTYEYIQERKLAPHSTESEFYDKGDDHVPISNDDDAASDGSDDDGTFKITIRSTAAKDIIVTVRSTTTCGAIVETFIKRSSLKASKKARLQIDGESMKPDVTIGDTDLEDGDMVDVVGI